MITTLMQYFFTDNAILVDDVILEEVSVLDDKENIWILYLIDWISILPIKLGKF